MKNSPFRKKSLERIASPDALNQYLRVTNPSIWMILGAIMLLLAGAVLWGAFAKLDTKAAGVVVSDGTTAFCYVSEKDIDSVTEATPVELEGQELTGLQFSREGQPAEKVLTAYAMELGGFSQGEYVYRADLPVTPNRGNYSCSVVTERISPFYFLLNSDD